MSELHFQKKEEEAEFLFIPLPEGIAAEAVSVENRYLQRELWVYINGGSVDFTGRKPCTETTMPYWRVIAGRRRMVW